MYIICLQSIARPRHLSTIFVLSISEIINLIVFSFMFIFSFSFFFLFSEPGPARCLWVSPASFGKPFQGCYCAPHRTGCNSFIFYSIFFLWIVVFITLVWWLTMPLLLLTTCFLFYSLFVIFSEKNILSNVLFSS